jgi:hypothetical protein
LKDEKGRIWDLGKEKYQGGRSKEPKEKNDEYRR